MPLKGPFQLTTPIIDKLVEGHVAGVYVVRRIEDTGDFAQWTGLLGRAEADLGAEIKKWIGTEYRLFLFEQTSDAETAGKRERELWKDLGGGDGKLDNSTPP